MSNVPLVIPELLCYVLLKYQLIITFSVTYPLDLTKTRLQIQGEKAGHFSKNVRFIHFNHKIVHVTVILTVTLFLIFHIEGGIQRDVYHSHWSNQRRGCTKIMDWNYTCLVQACNIFRYQNIGFKIQIIHVNISICNIFNIYNIRCSHCHL